MRFLCFNRSCTGNPNGVDTSYTEFEMKRKQRAYFCLRAATTAFAFAT